MAPPEIPFNLRADAFAGTARDYLRFRPPYPSALLDDLCRRAGVTGSGRLLDLGCGPGRVALPLARRFRDVVAVDQEPEMIDVGREEAARLAVGNITWVVGRAEDVAEPAGSVELVTMGESFHRLDGPLILGKIRGWLRPGGCVAVLGCRNVWGGTEPWQRVLNEVRHRWKRPRVAFGHPSAPKPDERYLDVIARGGFDPIGHYEFAVPLTWSVESLIGNAYTTSILSRQALGRTAAAFEADLTRKMLAHEPSGRFVETTTFAYTLACRPG